MQVEIKEFEILEVAADRVRFRARVTSGTYMRSVAHDMGRELACGAHLESLRRTSVAEFTLAEAHTLEEVAAHCDSQSGRPDHSRRDNNCHPDRSVSFPQGMTRGVEGPAVDAATPSFSHSLQEGGDFDSLEALCVHPRKLLPLFPSVTADELTAARIRSGRTVNLPDLSRARQVKVFAGQRDLIAIATRVAGTLFHPKLVLCS